MSEKKFKPTFEVTVEGNLGTDPTRKDNFTSYFVVIGGTDETVACSAIIPNDNWNARLLSQAKKGSKVIMRGRATLHKGKNGETNLSMTYVDRAYVVAMPPKGDAPAGDDLPF